MAEAFYLISVSLVSQVEALLHIYIAKNIIANIILAAFKTIVSYRCDS